MTTTRIVFTLGLLGAWLTISLPAASASHLAVLDLKHILESFRRIHGLSMHFTCQKKLSVLKRPFVSSGSIAMIQPDRVRFTTRWPYRSCFILHGNRVYMRTQNNRRWHVGKGSRQQVVQQIMQQFAGWSLGHAEDISGAYHVQKNASRVVVRPPPHAPRAQSQLQQRPFPHTLQLFTLIPKSRTVRRAVGAIELGFSGRHPQLRYIKMQLVHGNNSCYWLTDIQINPHFPPDEFQPKGPP